MKDHYNGDIESFKEGLRREYSDTATEYDEQRSINKHVLAYFERSYAIVNSLIGTTSEDTIHIDMPVGTSRFIRYLREHGRVHKIIGVDIAPGMLEVSRHVCADDAATTLCYGDAFALQFPDNSIDLFTSLRFFHLFPKRYYTYILREMYRVLRPGGLLVTDMRNVLRGGALAMIKEYRDRWFHGERPHSFIAPYEISSIFSNWEGMQTGGVGLDGANILSNISPGMAFRLEEFGSTSALRYFTKELVVAVRKP